MRKFLTRVFPVLAAAAAVATSAAYAQPVYQVVGQYTDRENEVTVDLYMEPLDKFLDIVATDPLSATDPERIVADSINFSLPPGDRTFLMVSDLVLPRCEGPPACFFNAFFNVQSIVDQGLLIFDVPYIVLAVYTDGVPRATGMGGDLDIRFYGTNSPGVFVFDAEDFAVPPFGLIVEAIVDPFTERPIGEIPGSEEEKVDIGWEVTTFPPDSKLTLYYDRDNLFQVRDGGGNLVATLPGGTNFQFNNEQFFSNNGVEGIDFGTIDLTSDNRFPPPPPTGAIDVDAFPDTLTNGVPYNWDFSNIPQGRYYIYGLLEFDGRTRVVDYSTFALQIGTSPSGDIPRWPFLIGDAVDDRFVQGVAINDVVASATNLDIVAITQSGKLRVLDHQGRSWPPYEINFDVTIDTAPTVTDIDQDDELEILLGTNFLSSDVNPLFAERNAVVSIDSIFRPAYEQALASVVGGTRTVEEALTDFGLVNDIYFLPPGHRVFSTPFVRELGGGVREVVYVSRPANSGGDSIIESVAFSDLENVAPAATATIQPVGVGVLGTPSVGNVDGDPELEIVVGSQSGKVYVFELESGAIGNPIFALADAALQSEAMMRAPALADIDGDGDMEIFIAVSERDVDLPGRTQLHLMHGDGASAVPGAEPNETLLYEPLQEFSSLSTPVVAKLGLGAEYPLAVLFATEGAFVGIDVATGPEPVILFEETFGGSNRAFAASSPVVGQFQPGNNAYEIIIGGGRGTSGNLFGVVYDPAAKKLNILPTFASHPEPILPGRAIPASILGSPEMADVDGNQRTDVLYTNEEGYIDLFQSPDAFAAPLLPADFPWPFFKHDHNRSGALGAPPVPVAPFLAGDINRDGVVDENDLFEMALRWSSSKSFPSSIDTGGGKVADDERKMPQQMLMNVLGAIRAEK